MITKSTGLTLLVLIAPCLAAAPPGSRGTIDFRYPDYIVNPLPECPSEGVFPHPKNCTWYYRCTDTYQIGFYRRFYFECEPGTVFSDELDQCIHPFNPTYPCAGALVQKPISKPEPDCSESFFIRCKFYYCPMTGGSWTNIGSLCDSAYSKCSDGTEKHYCQGPEFYDVNKKDCVQSPLERNCVNKDTFFSTSTTTTTTTTETPTTPQDDCYYSVVGCKDYQCPNSLEKETFCKKRFKTCNKNEVTFFCHGEQYYKFGTTQCIDPPSKLGCVEMPTEDSGVVSAVIPVDPASLTFSFTVECSPQNARPRNQQLVDYFCRDHKACVGGTSSKIELCEKYLQCLYDEETKKWSAKVSTCPPDLHFSFDEDACIQKPKETC